MNSHPQISIIDPNLLSCEGLKRVLGGRRFKVGRTWPNSDAALEAATMGEAPAAILMNFSGQALPEAEDFEQLRQAYPGTRLILFGEELDPTRVQAAAKAEVDGFLLASIKLEALPKAIELILLGERLFPAPSFDKGRKSRPSPHLEVSSLATLSTSEMRVLALLAKACANKVIARELGISESTVKVHVKAILRKTGAKNRTDVALLSRDLGAKAYLESVASGRSENSVGREGNSFLIERAEGENGRLM